MAEAFTLTTPVSTPSLTTWVIIRLYLTWDEASIYIELKGTNGERLEHRYDGTVARALIVGLNKANLSVKSLQKRVMESLVADGVLPAGSITGAPD